MENERIGIFLADCTAIRFSCVRCCKMPKMGHLFTRAPESEDRLPTRSPWPRALGQSDGPREVSEIPRSAASILESNHWACRTAPEVVVHAMVRRLSLNHFPKGNKQTLHIEEGVENHSGKFRHRNTTGMQVCARAGSFPRRRPAGFGSDADVNSATPSHETALFVAALRNQAWDNGHSGGKTGRLSEDVTR